jgi:hypothetical protein
MDETLPTAFDPTRETEKVLLKAKERLAKKFSWKKKAALFDSVLLAHLLVVFSKDEEAIEVCAALGRIQFNGKWDLWAAVELALALQARLCRQKGDTSTADICHKRIAEAGYVDDRLDGSLLDCSDAIPESIKEGDKKWELEARLAYAAELAFIIELGGSARRPAKALESDWNANLTEMKRLAGAN